MKSIVRSTIKNIMAKFLHDRKFTLDWLENDSLYDSYKDGYFDEDMTEEQFKKQFENYDCEEDAFNENDLDDLIANFEKTLESLKRIRKDS
jgi:hypothetical protein